VLNKELHFHAFLERPTVLIIRGKGMICTGTFNISRSNHACFSIIISKNSPAVKKCEASKKAVMKKYQGGSQEMHGCDGRLMEKN